MENKTNPIFTGEIKESGTSDANVYIPNVIPKH